jgi:hypothetical protein
LSRPGAGCYDRLAPVEPREVSMHRLGRLLTPPVVGLALPGLALACSGPGAMATILRSERLGWMLWGATLLLAVAVALVRLRADGWRAHWPLLLLVGVHPGWWMSARSGDCGRMLVLGSILVTALAPLVVGFLLWRSLRAARRKKSAG